MQISTHGNKGFGIGLFALLVLSISLVLISWNGKNAAELKRWEKEYGYFQNEIHDHNQKIAAEILGE